MRGVGRDEDPCRAAATRRISSLARRADASYRPGETVNAAKQRSVIRTAEAYLAERRLGLLPCRFDVAEVFLDTDQQPERIEVIENAFAT